MFVLIDISASLLVPAGGSPAPTVGERTPTSGGLRRFLPFRRRRPSAGADIDDQLENVEECFNPPHIEVLRRTAHDMANHLNKAKTMAARLVHTASLVIVDAGKET